MLLLIADKTFKYYTFPLVTVSSLFEIKSGVLDDGSSYFYMDEKENHVPLRMLRMSSFDLPEKRLKNPRELAKAESNIKKLRKERKEDKPKEVKDPKKILSKDDFLICTREVNDKPFTGISLLNSLFRYKFEDLNGPFIVSHHFLVLKPRRDTPYEIDIPFLHILMNSVIETKLRMNIEGVSKITGIAKRDLENEKVIYPPLQEQKEIVEEYNKLSKELSELKMKLSALEGMIAMNSQI